MSLPILVSDHQVRSFKYYWEGQIRTGMSFKGHLYALHDCFTERDRTLAYEKGCRLAERCEVIITVSQALESEYRLWIEIAATTNPQLLATPPQDCDCQPSRRASLQMA